MRYRRVDAVLPQSRCATTAESMRYYRRVDDYNLNSIRYKLYSAGGIMYPIDNEPRYITFIPAMKRSISCREKFGPTQHITIYFDDVSDIDYYMSLFVNVASYKFPKHIDKYAIEYITNRVRGTQCKAYTTPDTTLHTTQHPTAYTTFDNTQLRNYVLAKYNSAPNAPAKKPTVKGKNAMVNFIKNIMCGDISDSEAGSIVDWMLTGVV